MRQVAVCGVQAGYEHYELSNYALPGHQCRHNLVYWSGSRPFYGFGLGAASCLAGRRATRPRAMHQYRHAALLPPAYHDCCLPKRTVHRRGSLGRLPDAIERA